MSDGARYEVVFRQANAACREGRFADAGLLYGRLCEEAAAVGEYYRAYWFGMYEARALKRAGKPLEALKRMMVMDNWPAPSSEVLFNAKTDIFDVLRRYQPNVQHLRVRLRELEQLAAKSSHGVVADYRLYEYLFWKDQGVHEQALKSIELAWSERGEATKNHAHSTASCAFLANLRLNRREEAERWLRIIERDGEFDCIGYRVDLADARVDLALFDGRYEEAACYAQVQRRAAKEYGDHSRVHDAIVKEARTLLLESNGKDPLEQGSRLPLVLKDSPPGQRDARSRFEFALATSDVRLAAVRWAVGMPTAEDLWYQTPQVVDSRPRADRAEVISRVDKASLALRRAEQIARQFDQAFSCEWRRETVARRKKRLLEIVSKVS